MKSLWRTLTIWKKGVKAMTVDGKPVSSQHSLPCSRRLDRTGKVVMG